MRHNRAGVKLRYAGTWSVQGYRRHRAEFESWIRKHGWTVTVANEVLIPVSYSTDDGFPWP